MKSMQDSMSECTTAGWVAAKKVYEEGENSKKSSGKRTIQGFALKKDEPIGDIFLAYKAKHDPHKLVEAALAGTDSTTAGYKGKFGTGTIAGKCSARKQIVQKVGKFQIMMQYAAHEFEAALTAYGKGDYEAAVHYWDEWWAFYAGSLGGMDYAPYMLAKKRAENFGTDTKLTTVDTDKSAVNCMLLQATKQGAELLKNSSNTDKLADITKCMRAQLKVPLIQGCLRYGYRTACGVGYSGQFDEGCDKFENGTTIPGRTSSYPHTDKKAEMAAFCSGAAAFLNEVSSEDADKLQVEYTMDTDTKIPSWPNVKAVFSQKNLNKMGIKCADVGSLEDGGYPNAAMPVCTDVPADFTNANADSNKCSAAESDPCTCVDKTKVLTTTACDATCKADHACTKTAPAASCETAPTAASGSFLHPMLPIAAACAAAAVLV
jgi:hypothetical protein